MATQTYKVLGQLAPSATTETDLYTVAASTQAIISTIQVSNRSSSDATFRISVSVAGAATANKDYISYDVACAGNGFVAYTMGITLGAADKIRVYASTANLSFAVFGSEIA
jgi:glucose-6-phosphate dehydrogenase assembly protein OpcA